MLKDLANGLEVEWRGLLGGVRFPFEWQVAKEQVWSNPFFAVACLVEVGTLAAVVVCSLSFLFGEFLAGLLFLEALSAHRWLQQLAMVPGHFVGAGQYDSFRYAFRRLGDSRITGAGTSASSASWMRSTWGLALGGILETLGPALAVSYVFAVHSSGPLGKLRLDTLSRLLKLAAAACAGGLLFLVSLAHSWDLGMCRKIEEQTDLPCQLGGAGSPEAAGFICSLETAAQCEMVILTVYTYEAAAALVLVGVVLCAAGLRLEHRRLEERWPALKRDPCGADDQAVERPMWRSGACSERQSLLQ